VSPITAGPSAAGISYYPAPTSFDDLGRPRQIRVQISGGREDIEALAEKVKAAVVADGVNATEWELSFEECKPWGEVGPLHKASLGFTQKP